MAVAYALRGDAKRARRFLKKAQTTLDDEVDASKTASVEGSKKQFMLHKQNEQRRQIKEFEELLLLATDAEDAQTTLRPAFRRLFFFPPSNSRVPFHLLAHAATSDFDKNGSWWSSDVLPALFSSNFEDAAATPTPAASEASYYVNMLSLGVAAAVPASLQELGQGEKIHKLRKVFKGSMTSDGQGDLTRAFRKDVRHYRLEVCSGSGDWVLGRAKSDLTVGWVALELRHDRVYQIFSKSVLHRVPNLCVMGGDAMEAIQSRLCRNIAFEEVYINFPEPPPYFDHPSHLLSVPFFKTLHAVLKPNASLYVVSDNLPYLTMIGTTLAKLEGTYTNQHDGRPYKPGLPEGFGTDSSYFDRFWTNGARVSRGYVHFVRV